MNAIKDLKETDLFKGLDTKQLQLFGKHFTEKTLETGELVFAQGGLAENLYILLEGEVTLGIKAKGEVDITASSVGKKGETFGLSSLIKPYRNNVSATCTKKTKLFIDQWRSSKETDETEQKGGYGNHGEGRRDIL
jgi:CRP-like cAMP-binding protein